MTDKVKALSAKELREYKWHALLNPSSDKERLRRLLATIAADRKRLAELEGMAERAEFKANMVMSMYVGPSSELRIIRETARYILEGDSAAKGEL